jgi:hypothetical protein
MPSRIRNFDATDYACRGIKIVKAIKSILKDLMRFQPNKKGRMLQAISHVQSARQLVQSHKNCSYHLARIYEGDENIAPLIAKFITDLIELERIVSCSSLQK